MAANIRPVAHDTMPAGVAKGLVFLTGVEPIRLADGRVVLRTHFSFDYGVSWASTLVGAFQLANSVDAIRANDIPTDHHISHILARRAEERMAAMQTNQMFESFRNWLHPEEAEEEAELDRWLAERNIAL